MGFSDHYFVSLILIGMYISNRFLTPILLRFEKDGEGVEFYARNFIEITMFTRHFCSLVTIIVTIILVLNIRFP